MTLNVSLSGIMDKELLCKNIEANGKNVIGRATTWENGDLVLDVIEIMNGAQVILKRFENNDIRQFGSNLDLWLNEMTKYESSPP